MKIADLQLNEIERLHKYDYEGGKDELGGYTTPKNKILKPLPGGSNLQYAIKTDSSDTYYTYIYIVDPVAVNTTDKPVKHRLEFNNEYAKRLKQWSKTTGKPQPSIVAKLSVSKADLPIPNAVEVGSITVDEDYRNRGLAKALYGIVLSIMKKTLVAGSSQTPGGRRNWVSLTNIPGVEVKGFVQLDTEQLEVDPDEDPSYAMYSSKEIDKNHDTLMKLGGQFIGKNRFSELWAFDVLPGKSELKPAVKTVLSQIYDQDGEVSTGLYARWTGK